MTLSPGKKIISLIAVLLTGTILLSGTFAWQSLNQEALNYVRGGVNPGGRLHDDFTNITLENDPETGKPYTAKTFDKDVYVENFTSAADDGVNIYARIRLDEYLEYGKGAGTTGSGNLATSLVDNANLTDKSTWTTFIPDSTGSVFREYWTLSWSKGGSAIYMPTFNKNKDSLLADINGTFEGGYVKYALDSQKTGHIVQDSDINDVDELNEQTKLADMIEKGTGSVYYSDYAQNIQLSEAITHTAAATITAARSMSMEEWLKATDNGDSYNEDEHGACWVYDEDGWFYWSAPIHPGTATGKLLDQIQRTGKSIGNDGDEWYYGLNVVAQFITSDSLGAPAGDGQPASGFYDGTKGEPPTENALLLLGAIGVDTTGSNVAAYSQTPDNVEVGNEYELRKALENGSDATLTDDIVIEQTVFVKQDTSIYMEGYDIIPASTFCGDALFTIEGDAWLDFNNSGILCAPDDGYVVRVEDNGVLYIWDGTFIGSAGVVYVENGEAMIVDGTFYLIDDSFGQIFDWDDESTAKITIYGGTFYNFDPSVVNGMNLLADGYSAKLMTDGSDTVYIVVAGAPDDEPENGLLNEEQPDNDEVIGDAAANGETAGGNAENALASGTEADGEVSASDSEKESQPITKPEEPADNEYRDIVEGGIFGKADVVPEISDTESNDAAGDASESGDATGSDTADNNGSEEN